jgi:predicted metal-dependent hydrolase
VRRFDHARSMRLSVDPRDGTVRLSLPPRASLAKALRWAEERREWVEATLAELPKPIRIMPGVALPFNGGTLIVEWRKSLPRTPVRVGDRLRLGGPLESLSRRVLSWLRAEAGRVLVAETRALAKRHNITVGTIGVGDPRSRWGSCTAAGNIRYSWRLIMAPGNVRRATVAHELAHRVHMDHSPRFHRTVAKLHGDDPAAARDWLKLHGSALYWVGAPG